MFKGRHSVDVVLLPEPAAHDVLPTHAAHLVIADQAAPAPDRSSRARGTCATAQLNPAGRGGLRHIDHRAAAEYGVPRANAAGYDRGAVADWTILAILSLSRHGSWGDRQMHAGWWNAMNDGRQLGLSPSASSRSAMSAEPFPTAHGLRLEDRLHRPRPNPGVRRRGARRARRAVRRASVVCLHPLDVETRGLIGAASSPR